MKYFFLSLIALAVLVVGVFGFRGDKFSQAPIQVFPDMDDQDKGKAQTASRFFANGMNSRNPVLGTVPRNAEAGVMPLEFGAGRSGYYFDGKSEGTFGNGLPKELEIKEESQMVGLLGRGKDMFNVNCAICHGAAGDGKGVVSVYFGQADPIIAVPSLHDHPQDKSPDGYIYEVISNGKGSMGAYKHNLPVRDRWAIVFYLRALQASAK
ncbi:MAG: mono/diheme cytochrome c family protein [Akkermansiaceae bacterium]|jgi:mono/diheme cytochrome c family protein